MICMKIAIIYISTHHGNTKKIINEMSKETNIDLLKISEAKKTDLTQYDTIGFASGVYFHKLHKNIIKLAEEINLTNKKVFIVYTCGINYINYAKSLEKIIKSKNCEYLGCYTCKGYDTYGFFEKIGGIAKNHPNEKDLKKAREFIKNIIKVKK